MIWLLAKNKKAAKRPAAIWLRMKVSVRDFFVKQKINAVGAKNPGFLSMPLLRASLARSCLRTKVNVRDFLGDSGRRLGIAFRCQRTKPLGGMKNE